MSSPITKQQNPPYPLITNKSLNSILVYNHDISSVGAGLGTQLCLHR